MYSKEKYKKEITDLCEEIVKNKKNLADADRDQSVLLAESLLKKIKYDDNTAYSLDSIFELIKNSCENIQPKELKLKITTSDNNKYLFDLSKNICDQHFGLADTKDSKGNQCLVIKDSCIPFTKITSITVNAKA